MSALPLDRSDFAPQHFRQGDFDISILSDGTIEIPGAILTVDAGAAERAELYRRLNVRDGAVAFQTNVPRPYQDREHRSLSRPGWLC